VAIFWDYFLICFEIADLKKINAYIREELPIIYKPL
jgi:hypothetical protein